MIDQPIAHRVDANLTKIIGVGTATPPTAYSQQEVLDLIDITDVRARKMYMSSAIERRFLTLPEPGEAQTQGETQGQLLAKHRRTAIETGSKALLRCLESCGAELHQVHSLCCVTSTGLLTPGLSALIGQELGLRANCNRWDIVGMGCNAGLNGLNAATSWAKANPGKLSIVLCIEMCSAAYVQDGKIETSVVNSLFGDGAACAAVICNSAQAQDKHPAVVDFASHIVENSLDAMKFDWDDSHGKFSFFLGKHVPYVIGANVEEAVGRLLSANNLRKSAIRHWVIHSGGKKVIDSIKINLGLSTFDVRHTTSVLRDFGNVSSGSFLFSFERLLAENATQKGDLGVMITMGPGATIETALLQF